MAVSDRGFFVLSGDVNAESLIELAAVREAEAALEVAELADLVLVGAPVAPDLAGRLLLLLLGLYDEQLPSGEPVRASLTLRLPYRVFIVNLQHSVSFILE
jgi:hypothetical protein